MCLVGQLLLMGHRASKPLPVIPNPFLGRTISKMPDNVAQLEKAPISSHHELASFRKTKKQDTLAPGEHAQWTTREDGVIVAGSRNTSKVPLLKKSSSSAHMPA